MALLTTTLFGLALADPPQPAPAIAPLDLHGRPYAFDALKGSVVVVDFWASWCLPCRESFPFLEGLSSRYAKQGLKVVAITMEDELEAIDGFVAAYPVHFPVLRDPSQKSGEAFGVVAMPSAYVIDRAGNVVARFEGSGPRVHAGLELAVRALLDGQPVPPGTDVRIAEGVKATGGVKAWRRGYLADPIMNLDGDPLTRVLREHVHASKEAAAGDGGAAGGGCGCN